MLDNLFLVAQQLTGTQPCGVCPFVQVGGTSFARVVFVIMCSASDWKTAVLSPFWVWVFFISPVVINWPHPHFEYLMWARRLKKSSFFCVLLCSYPPFRTYLLYIYYISYLYIYIFCYMMFFVHFTFMTMKCLGSEICDIFQNGNICLCLIHREMLWLNLKQR